jgi:hypothetical protein
MVGDNGDRIFAVVGWRAFYSFKVALKVRDGI